MTRTFTRRERWAGLRALHQRSTYRVIANMLRVGRNPVDFFGRYVLGRGRYPVVVALRSPTGPIELTAFHPDDILTISEVFLRLDYRASAEDRVVVDFGANIGVSAAYFLSRSDRCRVYAFEPLPQNIERLRANLEQFADRVEVHEQAVGLSTGMAEFGWEPTGRYGGIGNRTGRYLFVSSVDVNEALGRVLHEHDRIDIVKIDVETLEGPLLAALDPNVAARIDRLYVELQPASNPLSSTHEMHQRGSVACFTRRPSSS